MKRLSFAERTTRPPSSEEESETSWRYLEGPASESEEEEEDEEDEDDPDPDPEEEPEDELESDSEPEESSPPQNFEACV